MRAINFEFNGHKDVIVEHNGRYILESSVGGVAIFAYCKRDLMVIDVDTEINEELKELCVPLIIKDRLDHLSEVKEVFSFVNDKPKIILRENVDLSDYIIDFGIISHEEVLSNIGK
jgi:hypothetical protein